MATSDRNARGRRVFEWAVFWDKETMAAVRNGPPESMANMLMSEEQVRALVAGKLRNLS